MINCISWFHHSIPLIGEAVEPRCNVFAIPPSVVSFINLMNLPPRLPLGHGSVAHIGFCKVISLLVLPIGLIMAIHLWLSLAFLHFKSEIQGVSIKYLFKFKFYP